MADVQAAVNHGDEWAFASYLRWGVYSSIPTSTHSQNSLAPAEKLSLKISSNDKSLKLTQRSSQSAQE